MIVVGYVILTTFSLSYNQVGPHSVSKNKGFGRARSLLHLGNFGAHSRHWTHHKRPSTEPVPAIFVGKCFKFKILLKKWGRGYPRSATAGDKVLPSAVTSNDHYWWRDSSAPSAVTSNDHYWWQVLLPVRSPVMTTTGDKFCSQCGHQ